MSENTFDVVFKGQLVEGAVPEKVKANVAALFKVEVAKVERLFSGATVAIKKGVDEQTAKKYQLALKKAGAICAVVNRAAGAATEAKPSTPVAEPSKPAAQRASFAVDEPQPAATGQRATFAVDEPQPSGQRASFAVDEPQPSTGQRASFGAEEPSTEAGSPPPSATSTEDEVMPSVEGLHKSVVKQAPQGLGELEAVNVEAPGAVLVEHEEVPEPQIDTSSLVMDEVGVELVPHQEVAELQVDTSALSMGEVGEMLGDEEPVEELTIDISALSMDEPGATLTEHEEVPELEVDTSKLSMD